MSPKAQDWPCPHCRKICDSQYDICWNCGSHRDGTPADPDFVRFDAKLPVSTYVSPTSYRVGRFLAGAVAVVGWLAIIVGVVALIASALKGLTPQNAGESFRLVSSGGLALLFATLCRAVFDIADGRAPKD